MFRKLLPVCVAAVVAVLASSCGKHEKCADAKSAAECTKENFAKDKFTCVWAPTEGDKEACVENNAENLEKAAKAACKKHKADKDTCEKDANKIKVEGYEENCKFDDTKTDADEKCEPVKKS